MYKTIKAITPTPIRNRIGKIKATLFTTKSNYSFAKQALLTPSSQLPYARSYSQEGEDMLVRSLMKRKATGFYVDIGAHHPYRFSNTAHFYELGWDGINVDALPGSMEIFEKERPRDTNICCGVGAKGKLKFYIYDEPAVNTFDQAVVEQRKSENYAFSVVDTQHIDVKPLKEILDKNLPAGQQIDLLSVDVEGKDLEVLISNDWVKYRPQCILAEAYDVGIENLSEDPIAIFMQKNNYRLVSKTLNTLVFLDNIDRKSNVKK